MLCMDFAFCLLYTHICLLNVLQKQDQPDYLLCIFHTSVVLFKKVTSKFGNFYLNCICNMFRI